MKTDWFVKGKYLKEIKKGEISIYQWDVEGLQSNIYEAVSTNGIPVRIYQEPLSDMMFDTSSFSETFSDKVFDLPNNQELDGGSCESKCPALSICTFVQ